MLPFENLGSSHTGWLHSRNKQLARNAPFSNGGGVTNGKGWTRIQQTKPHQLAALPFRDLAGANRAKAPAVGEARSPVAAPVGPVGVVVYGWYYWRPDHHRCWLMPVRASISCRLDCAPEGCCGRNRRSIVSGGFASDDGTMMRVQVAHVDSQFILYCILRWDYSLKYSGK